MENFRALTLQFHHEQKTQFRAPLQTVNATVGKTGGQTVDKTEKAEVKQRTARISEITGHSTANWRLLAKTVPYVDSEQVFMSLFADKQQCFWLDSSLVRADEYMCDLVALISRSAVASDCHYFVGSHIVLITILIYLVMPLFEHKPAF
jgi:hypothetical protein